MKLKHFQIGEFNCSHTGRNLMQDDFLVALDELRGVCGFPFHINSGYRDPSHPEEAKKPTPGVHTQGIAADIRALSGSHKFEIVRHAIALGFTGIGIASTFVHVDRRKGTPVIWTY